MKSEITTEGVCVNTLDCKCRLLVSLKYMFLSLNQMNKTCFLCEAKLTKRSYIEERMECKITKEYVY